MCPFFKIHVADFYNTEYRRRTFQREKHFSDGHIFYTDAFFKEKFLFDTRNIKYVILC